MALAGVTYWGLNNGALAITDAGATDFVRRNLGIDTLQKRNIAALESLENPAATLGNYHDELNAKIAEAGAQWKNDVTSLLDKGLPKEFAERQALKWADQAIDKERTMLSFTYPLADNMDILATAQAKAGTAIHLGGKDKSDKYEKYKAAYKTRKAKKKAKAQK